MKGVFLPEFLEYFGKDSSRRFFTYVHRLLMVAFLDTMSWFLCLQGIQISGGIIHSSRGWASAIFRVYVGSSP